MQTAETIEPEEYTYVFFDKVTGAKQIILAHDSELATLKAKRLNKNLTFYLEGINRGGDNGYRGTSQRSFT